MPPIRRPGPGGRLAVRGAEHGRAARSGRSPRSTCSIAGEDWARARRPGVEAWSGSAWPTLPAWLGGREYLEDRFTVGDLMMASMLRILRHTDLVAESRGSRAYLARCEARPAFRRALRDHMARFAPEVSAAG